MFLIVISGVPVNSGTDFTDRDASTSLPFPFGLASEKSWIWVFFLRFPAFLLIIRV